MLKKRPTKTNLETLETYFQKILFKKLCAKKNYVRKIKCSSFIYIFFLIFLIFLYEFITPKKTISAPPPRNITKTNTLFR